MSKKRTLTVPSSHYLYHQTISDSDSLFHTVSIQCVPFTRGIAAKHHRSCSPLPAHFLTRSQPAGTGMDIDRWFYWPVHFATCWRIQPLIQETRDQKLHLPVPVISSHGVSVLFFESVIPGQPSRFTTSRCRAYSVTGLIHQPQNLDQLTAFSKEHGWWRLASPTLQIPLSIPCEESKEVEILSSQCSSQGSIPQFKARGSHLHLSKSIDSSCILYLSTAFLPGRSDGLVSYVTLPASKVPPDRTNWFAKGLVPNFLLQKHNHIFPYISSIWYPHLGNIHQKSIES